MMNQTMMLKMLKTLTPRLASSTVRDLQVDDLGRSQEQWVDKKIVEWIKVFAPPSAYEEARFLPSPFHLRLIIQQVTSFPCLAQLTRKLLSSLVPFEIIPLL